MNNLKVLLFDIDGTLLDPLEEGAQCMRRALMSVYGVAGPIESYDMSGKTDWQIVTDLMRLAGLNPKVVETRRRDVFEAYAREVEKAAPTMQMQILPGVTALLDRLVAMNNHFVLGLVTGNVREAVPHKLRAVGIDPAFFRFGAFGAEHIDRNQLPILALERLSKLWDAPVTGGEVLVIGDTPHDIACARHAGAKVFCVTTGRYDRDSLAALRPDYLLDDLSDTDAVMDILSHF